MMMLNSDTKFAIKTALATITFFVLALAVYYHLEATSRIVSQNIEALSFFAGMGVILNAAIFAGMATQAPNREQTLLFACMSAFMALQTLLFLLHTAVEFLQVSGLLTTMALSTAAARVKEVGDNTERAIGHLLGAFCSLLMVAIASA